jgi:hypothetical protein
MMRICRTSWMNGKRELKNLTKKMKMTRRNTQRTSLRKMAKNKMMSKVTGINSRTSIPR